MKLYERKNENALCTYSITWKHFSPIEKINKLVCGCSSEIESIMAGLMYKEPKSIEGLKCMIFLPLQSFTFGIHFGINFWIMLIWENFYRSSDNFRFHFDIICSSMTWVSLTARKVYAFHFLHFYFILFFFFQLHQQLLYL